MTLLLGLGVLCILLVTLWKLGVTFGIAIASLVLVYNIPLLLINTKLHNVIFKYYTQLWWSGPVSILLWKYWTILAFTEVSTDPVGYVVAVIVIGIIHYRIGIKLKIDRVEKGV